MQITIIEDEKMLSDQIAKRLNRKGYTTTAINSFSDYKSIKNVRGDVYIIDISLRDGSGFDIIEDLRKNKKSKSPIIITSGYDDVDKKVYGLDIGADDYLAKPYSIEELDARIRALLRRNYNNEDAEEIIYKSLSYNLKDKVVKKEGKMIDLTGRETQLIEYLILNIGRLVSKSELVHSVWGKYDELSVTDNNINVTFSKIRKKLGDEFTIKTIFNRGYILEE